MARNATTTKVAEATATIPQTGTTAPAAGTEPDTAPPARRAARGTGAGAKAATGRPTRTSRTPTATGRGSRAPAHTVADRTPVPVGADWTVEELAEVRADLTREIAERRADYDRALAEITRLQQSGGDGAGDDQADAGSKTFEREQELSIANNRRDLLVQMERAMERLERGTYGHCESCVQPIMKARLQAFPSATLCVKCKQREERR